MADLAASKVPVVWKTDPSEADRLLGKRARPVLDGIIELMQQAAIERKWPLKQINIRYRQDMEFPEWEILRVCAVLNANPEDGRGILPGFSARRSKHISEILGQCKKKKIYRKDLVWLRGGLAFSHHWTPGLSSIWRTNWRIDRLPHHSGPPQTGLTMRPT